MRQALALRKTPSGKPIWIEAVAVSENIMNMDMVWKPVNYQRSKGFEQMSKRVFMRPERPFAYNHFENIKVMTTKSGLIEHLGNYYSRMPNFCSSGFTLDHSMAMSFIINPSDFSDNSDLNQLRKIFQKFEKGNVFE